VTPGWLHFFILALACFRATRITGWDDFPPVAKARAWVVGEKVATAGSMAARHRLTNEQVGVAYTYRWPTLAHGLSCAFCAGAWWSAVFYAAWLEEPRYTMYVAVPLALSSFVGLTARSLDP